MITRAAKLMLLLALEAASCEFSIGIAGAAFVLALVSASKPTASNKFRVRQVVHLETPCR
jgi:hypothetical protein